MSSLETLCPRCGHEHPNPQPECAACGVIFAKLRSTPAAAGASQAAPSSDLGSYGFQQLIVEPEKLLIEQHHRHWWEILTEFEQRNEYSVMDPMRRQLGTVVEQGTGFVNAVVRVLAGSHRPFEIVVISQGNEVVLQLERPFFFLFSSMEVKGPTGRVIGRVERRFAVLNRRYDLLDASGQVFAQIVSRMLKIWTFPVVDMAGRERGMIAKKWSGLGREYFTDADNFGVDFADGGWSAEQRAVIFAAAIAIDFDFFENNQKR